MTETAPIDNRTLVRKTLVTAGAMVGACALVVSLFTGVALLAVGYAVSPGGGSEPGPQAATVVPMANVHGGAPRPMIAAPSGKK